MKIIKTFMPVGSAQARINEKKNRCNSCSTEFAEFDVVLIIQSIILKTETSLIIVC